LRHIKSIKDYSIVCGMGAVLVFGLVGCSSGNSEPKADATAFTQASQKQGAFVVVEEVAPKQYKIAEEYPAKTTRVILKTLDGKEKILSKEELDKLVKEEAKKIEEGKSPLTNPQINSGMGGMSLGETILASAAGAVLGSWIGSKLFNNPTYQQQRQRSYKSPATYNRSINSFNKSKTSILSSKRGGFFKRTTTAPIKRSSGFFGRSGSFRSFGG
jgi:hypothetical protein